MAGRQVTKEDRIAGVDTGMGLTLPPLGGGEQKAGLSWTAALSSDVGPAGSSPAALTCHPSGNLLSAGAQNPSPPQNKERRGEAAQLWATVP